MNRLKTLALLLAAVFVGLLFCVRAEAAGGIPINKTNFPDDIFRAHVKDYYDTDKDGKLSPEEIEAAEFIDVGGLGCKSLKGLEYLTNAEGLDCSNNKLTELNLSKNINLVWLNCSGNQLKTLNFNNCERLSNLNCEGNLLTELDLSKVILIEEIICYNNNITTLDIHLQKLLTTAYTTPDAEETDEGHTLYYYDDYGVCYSLDVDNTTKILSAPKITSPAENTEKTVKSGKKVSLKVTAKGTGLKYQWYYKKPGSSKLIKVSAKAGKKATYTFKAAAKHNGYTYICKVTNKYGTTTSKEIKLNVTMKPKITSPKKATTKTVALGKQASFKIKATGATTYQWEYRVSKNDPWQQVTLASGKTANLKVTVQQRHNGYQYRCKVTNVGGQYVYSKIFTLKVKS